MANWEVLKQAISSVIKANNNEEITGSVLQQVLINMVNSLREYMEFAGMATPDTNPGAPDGPVFYIASKSGEYSNFGGIIIDKEVAIIRNTADGSWEKINTGIVSVESLIEGGEIVVKVDVKPATETILGGINASPKTDNETAEAKIGEDNKLYVPASTSAKNLADEEDLTSKVEDSKSVMKFADKAYDTSSFSGQGRVYLRKNIVLGKNILTQSMINDANTRYIIQYDYDLNGETLTIPEGCTLDFQGGRLFNGTLIGSITGIISPITQIFGTDISIIGTWSIEFAYPEWFGAKGDGVTDDTIPICLCFKYFINTKLDAKTYCVSSIYDKDNDSSLVLPERHNVYGSSVNHNLTSLDISTIKVDSVIPKIILRVIGASIVDKITIVGNSRDESVKQSGVSCISGYFSHGNFNRVNIRQCYYGFNLQLWSVAFTQCYTGYCGIGFFLHGQLLNDTTVSVEATTVTMIGCLGVDSLFTGIKLVGLTYSSIINCGFDGCGWGGYDTPIPFNRTSYSYAFYQCRDISVISCGAEQATKAILVSNCQDVSFFGINLVMKSTGLEDDFDFSKTIFLSWSVRIFFQGIRINLSEKYIFIEHDPNNTGINCIFNGVLLKDKITYYGIQTNTVLFNNYSPVYGTYSTREKMKKDIGQQFYDTTLKTHIYYDGSYWRYLNSDKYLKESVLYTEDSGHANIDGDNYMYSYDLSSSEYGINEGDILYIEWAGESPSDSIYQLLIAFNGGTYIGESTVVMKVPANTTTIRIQMLFSANPGSLSFSICRMLPQ